MTKEQLEYFISCLITSKCIDFMEAHWGSFTASGIPMNKVAVLLRQTADFIEKK